jgi:Glycosyl hydrolases family 16
MELVNRERCTTTQYTDPLAANSASQWKQSADGFAGIDLAQDYHVYQVYREPGLMKIGIDGYVVVQYTRSTMPAGASWVLDATMYLTLNIAVGEVWPGAVGPGTPFPATMLVDWIRFWQ